MARKQIAAVALAVMLDSSAQESGSNFICRLVGKWPM